MVRNGVCAVLLCGLLSCGKRDAASLPGEGDAEGWKSLLGQPARASAALFELARRKDPAMIAVLGEAWSEQGQPPGILQVLVDTAAAASRGGPHWDQALPYLVKAVESSLDLPERPSHVTGGALAAEALGRARDPGGLEILVRAATHSLPPDAPGQRVRLAAVRALGRFDDRKAVAALVTVISLDPAEQPSVVVEAAVESLAGRTSPAAVQAMVLAMVKSPAVLASSRASLATAGAHAIGPLVELLRGEHAAAEAYAAEHGLTVDCDERMGHESKCRGPGLLPHLAASALGDLREPTALMPLLDALRRAPLPVAFDRSDMPQGVQHGAILAALVRTGDGSAAEPLLAFGLDPDGEERLRAAAILAYARLTRDRSALPRFAAIMVDEEADTQLRLGAAYGFARLVREESELAPLREAAERNRVQAEEWTRQLGGLRAELDARKKEVLDIEAQIKVLGKERAAPLVKSHRLLADRLRTAEIDWHLAEGKVSWHTTWRRIFEGHVIRAAVGVRCKEDVACYVSQIERDADAIAEEARQWIPDIDEWGLHGRRELERAVDDRAVIELGGLRAAAPEVLPALLSYLGSADARLREAALDAAVRVAPRPCRECAERLDGILAQADGDPQLREFVRAARAARHYFARAAE
jgi:HEAT repeat protein